MPAPGHPHVLGFVLMQDELDPLVGDVGQAGAGGEYLVLFAERHGYGQPGFQRAGALLLTRDVRNGMGRTKEDFAHQGRCQPRVGFQHAGHRAGYQRRGETGAVHVLVVRRDQLLRSNAFFHFGQARVTPVNNVKASYSTDEPGNTGATTQMLGATSSGLGMPPSPVP